MSDNDLITIPDPSPAERYTRELASRIVTGLNISDESAIRHVEMIFSTALLQAHRDIIAGRFVPLEHIGEFVAVDNRGPFIRYQADRKLLRDCCLQNLKQAGEER